jgi:mercuric ion binding protein
MKIIQSVTIVIMILMLSHAKAQTDTVRIHTSAICEQCKERIENDLSFEKGIKSSHVDLEKHLVTVIYHPKKTDAQKIREAISKIGYDADSLKADVKSYRKLPDCCKHDSGQH